MGFKLTMAITDRSLARLFLFGKNQHSRRTYASTTTTEDVMPLSFEKKKRIRVGNKSIPISFQTECQN